MVASLLIKNCVAVNPQGYTLCSVLIDGDKIVALLAPKECSAAEVTIDANHRFVVPGAIDTHVHLGIGDQSFADDCATESRSAVSGGVTTLMHYLMEPGSLLKVFDDYKRAVEANSFIDVFFHSVLFTDKQLAEVEKYITNFHISSFKFLMSMNRYETQGSGFTRPGDGFLLDGFTTIAKHPGCISLLHAENSEIILRLRPRIKAQGRTDVGAWTDSRPAFCEEEAISRGLFLAKVANMPLAIAHMTTAGGVQLLIQQKREHPNFYGETCPHYLLLHKDLPLGVLGKVNPPLRSRQEVESLWGVVSQDGIDFIGSDHCPRRKSAKGDDLWSAESGLPGIAMILPILLSEGVRKHRITMEQLVRLTSYNAARIFGLYPQKGNIMVGADADLVILDLEKEVSITSEVLNSIVDWTPYEGYQCQGWPWITIAKGKVVYKEGQIIDPTPRGRVIRHSIFDTTAP
jgi:dihydroorotase (multifunctional complex type)